MNMLNLYCRHAATLIGAWLLAASLTANADEIQDANKLFRQGQQAQALDKVNKYLAGNPKDAQARFLKGMILTEQGQSNDAIIIFSALTKDYPELPEPYNNLAVLYANQGDYEKAKVELEKAIRTHPSYATANENLGDIYTMMASEAYKRALQQDRGNTTTKAKLAMIQDLFASGTKIKAAPVHNDIVVANKANPAPVSAAPATIVAAKMNVPEKNIPEKIVVPPAAESDKGVLKKEILKTVENWAASWSSKSVDKYLSHYSDDFHTPNGESREAWMVTRKERISKPKSIHVGLSDESVEITDNSHAIVRFHQSYHADHLKVSSHKTLMMVKHDGKWLIQEERIK